VNTGASDDIAALAAQIVGRNAWLHVDGAFGRWALAIDALRPSGVEHASSWSVDAHKWLNVPYDSGMAIVANQDAHRAAMDARCAYVGHGVSWVPRTCGVRAQWRSTPRCVRSDAGELQISSNDPVRGPEGSPRSSRRIDQWRS
jgi:glutamate/tyrosine decarboxylase-like PLP-dependent enzyme